MLYEGELREHRQPAGDARADDPARWAVEDVCDDRVAMRVRGGTAEPLVDPLTRFFVNSTSCVPPFVQHAGIAALTGPQDEPAAMMAEFRRRRDVIVGGPGGLPGVSCRIPRGAFYAFPNVCGVPLPADELARRLLDESGVALLAGTAFGTVGRDNLRLSYANSVENLDQALARIGAFLASL